MGESQDVGGVLIGVVGPGAVWTRAGVGEEIGQGIVAAARGQPGCGKGVESAGEGEGFGG